MQRAERPPLARLRRPALDACCSYAWALSLDSFRAATRGASTLTLTQALTLTLTLTLISFWEARGHAGSVCHALRGMMRSLLFATHVTPGRARREARAAKHPIADAAQFPLSRHCSRYRAT